MTQLGKVTPILLMLDKAKAREFYVDFLGFTVDWEHRFEPTTPLYMQLRKDSAVLHLSEHFGDGTPGTYLRIEVKGLDEYQQSLPSEEVQKLTPRNPRAIVGYS